MLFLPPDPEYLANLRFTLVLLAIASALLALAEVLEGGSPLLLVALPLAMVGVFLVGTFWLPDWVGWSGKGWDE